MEHNWFCPFCGQPMHERRDVANDTGRVSYTIGCLNPKHWATRRHSDIKGCETELERTFGVVR